MMRWLAFICALWIAAAAASPALADCNLVPSGSRPVGAIIYNSDHNILQYCADTVWKAMILKADGGCPAPAFCPNIGDICDDGNAGTANDPIFAGFTLYGTSCEALYVGNNNQSAASEWKTSTGANDIGTDSLIDGQSNDNQVADSATFPAFKLCKDLTDGGFTDWYLPARDELSLLWRNRAAINANAAGTFTTDDYWSSSESSTSQAWREDYGDSSEDVSTKTTTLAVRCVRRGAGGGAPTAGLIAHWKFDEGSGTTAADSAGSNNGTITGATWTAGALGQALNFDGTDDSVSAPSPFGASQDAYTMSAWLNGDALDSSPEIYSIALNINDKWLGGKDNQTWLCNKDDDFANPAFLSFTTGWHLLTCVYDGAADTLTMYLDGLQEDQVGSSGAANMTGTVRIGDPSAAWDGKIDDVRIYNRALSAQEIADLYDAGP